MPTIRLNPIVGIERPSNYQVPQTIRRDFPQEIAYGVSIELSGRRMLCRCGEGVWSMFRDNEEFVCECSACGEQVSFGMLSFSLLGVSKEEGDDVIDISGFEVCED